MYKKQGLDSSDDIGEIKIVREENIKIYTSQI
jgi:hypothetical protein